MVSGFTTKNHNHKDPKDTKVLQRDQPKHRAVAERILAGNRQLKKWPERHLAWLALTDGGCGAAQPQRFAGQKGFRWPHTFRRFTRCGWSCRHSRHPLGGIKLPV